jgi:hypothetical protein
MEGAWAQAEAEGAAAVAAGEQPLEAAWKEGREGAWEEAMAGGQPNLEALWQVGR